MRCLPILLMSLVLIPAAHAVTLERDPDAARLPYAWQPATKDAAPQDPADDAVIFDIEGRETFPPYVPDIRSASLRHDSKRWIVSLRLAEPIPERPRWPLQAQVFIDLPDAKAPAESGLAAGADLVCTGVRGRVYRGVWNTPCRYFEPGMGKWQDGGSVDTEAEGAVLTFVFPLEILPKSGASVRFAVSALSGAVLRSLDVLPGEGLPALPAPSETPPARNAASAWVPYAVAAVAVLAAGGAYVALRGRG